jgi:tight adherence protein B
MPLWVPLGFIFLGVVAGTLALLSAGISAYEVRRRRLAEVKDGRPTMPDMTVSTRTRKKADIDPAPLLSGFLQNSATGKQLQLAILRAGLVWRPSEFAAMTGAAALIGYLVGFLAGHANIPLGLLLAALAAIAPYIYLKAKHGQRQRRLSAQIPDMLDLLASSLRSGQSFLSGVQMIVSQMQPPITDEFARVIQEVKFGASLSDALDDMVHRTDNYDMELIISAVQTQLTVGGNLAEVLDNIGTMIRDRVRLAGEISAATAEGRMSAMILAGMPFLLAFIINVVSPGYLTPLFTETLGRMMLGAALVLMLSGMLIIRSMLNIDL